MTTRTLLRSLGVAATGGAAATLLGLGLALPARDAVIMAGLTSLAAIVTVGLGHAVLPAVAHRSVRDQALVVAAAGTVAATVGVAVAAQAMFLSSHDLKALLVILVAAGSAGIATAVHLGARVGAGSRSVAELVRAMADENGPAPGATLIPSALEFDRLADDIAAISADLEQSRARERALDTSRRDLVAWMSHDLRAPMASIRAMAEALNDGLVEDRATVHRYSGLLCSEIDRLSTLVEDLFELNRLTSCPPDLHLETVPLAGLVADVVSSMRPRSTRVGVALEQQVDAGIEVHASVPELSRALCNLLDNAIRHTPSGGRVLVRAGTDKDIAVVAVEDSCGGIPDGDLDRVFDTAFRGDNARSRNGGGGLGLTIAKGLVEAHKGSIVVDNRPAGCRFTMRWPRLSSVG